MQQRFFVSSQVSNQLHYILQITFRCQGFRHVVGGGHQFVPPGSVLNNLPLLRTVHKSVVNAERHRISVCKVRQNRLFFGCGWPFPHCPHTFTAVSTNKMIGEKSDRTGDDTVKKFLNPNFFRLFWREHFLLFLKHFQFQYLRFYAVSK